MTTQEGFKEGLEDLVRGAGRLIRGGARVADKVLDWTQPEIDVVLGLGAVNLPTIYAATEIIDKTNYSNPTNGLIMMVAGAVATTGNYLLLKKPVRELIGKVNGKINKVRPLSWLKTGILAGAILASGWALRPYTQQVIDDFVTHPLGPVAEAPYLPGDKGPLKVVPAQALKSRPSIYDSLGYKSLVEYDFSGTHLMKKESIVGRIQRTLRWQPIYRAVERKYGLPAGLIAGMIMQESYGDPLQPNAGDDGGLGLTHIQGTTGKEWGLDIHGSSNKASDKAHGKKLRALIKECGFDPACVQQYDDRAHFLKVLDTAGRIVRTGIDMYGDWEHGVEYYRGPGLVGHNTGWKYLQRVKKYRNAIRNPKMLQRAANDFSKRNNGASFKQYIKKWQEMNPNWGLREYATWRPGKR